MNLTGWRMRIMHDVMELQQMVRSLPADMEDYKEGAIDAMDTVGALLVMAEAMDRSVAPPIMRLRMLEHVEDARQAASESLQDAPGGEEMSETSKPSGEAPKSPIGDSDDGLSKEVKEAIQEVFDMCGARPVSATIATDKEFKNAMEEVFEQYSDNFERLAK